MNENATISDYEALNFALEHGIISMDAVREQMKKQKEKEILKNQTILTVFGKEKIIAGEPISRMHLLHVEND